VIAGIDLGTTNSLIAVSDRGTPTVVPNRQGGKFTPSAVRFLPDGSAVVGEAAIRAQVSDPRRVITESKRLIGRYFNEVLDLIDYLPYEVVRGEHDLAMIRVDGRDYAPQYVAALIIRALVEAAEAYAGARVTRAVIGVPAYFSDRQRSATAEAAMIAGIESLRFVAEPTLAAMFYGLSKKRDETVAVIDLGGGTFDVSILEVGEGVIETKAVSGDNFLGGHDFDHAIRDWLVQEIRIEARRDLTDDRMVRQHLLDAARDAKIQLSSRSETEIVLPFLTDTSGNPFAFRVTLSREKCEAICADLFERLRRPCAQALADAGLEPDRVDRVLLVGGATRMSHIARFAREFFQKEPNRALNPEEAVALGAGVQAGVFSGHVKDLLLLDTVPLSLGVEAANGASVVMITRNTTMPTRKTEVFCTALDDQRSVEIRVVQGEHPLAFANRTLGRLTLEGIAPGPAGSANIEITFDIDANGTLNVEARDLAGGSERRVTVKPGSGLTVSDIARLRTSAQATRLA